MVTRSTKQATITVSTILTPLERVRMNVASSGAYPILHRDSMDEVVDDLRTQRSHAVLISVSTYESVNSVRMAAMVREFPTVPAYALLTDDRKQNPHSVLSLGLAGVRRLIDARFPVGWQKLQDLLSNEHMGDLQREALQILMNDLRDVPSDCWRFFEILLTQAPPIPSAKALCKSVHVPSATLLSRFYRARLPSPKRYVDFIRLLRAARLLENRGLSISSVAKQLSYSSPQAFSRHTRALLALSPIEFRARHTGRSMLQLFRYQLVLPYVHIFRSFHPIVGDPAWVENVA